MVSLLMDHGNIFQHMSHLEGEESFTGRAFIVKVNKWVSKIVYSVPF